MIIVEIHNLLTFPYTHHATLTFYARYCTCLSYIQFVIQIINQVTYQLNVYRYACVAMVHTVHSHVFTYIVFTNLFNLVLYICITCLHTYVTVCTYAHYYCSTTLATYTSRTYVHT